MLLTQIRPAIVSFILLTMITGILYPLLVTGIAQSVYPQQAQGSLIKDANGKITGSGLIGQNFDDPKYEGRGKNEIRTVIQKEVYSDDNLHQLAKDIKQNYPQLPQSEEQIFQNMRAKKDYSKQIWKLLEPKKSNKDEF